MKQIIVVKPNSLDEANKKLLLEAGVILIEHQNPAEVRIITALEGIGDGDAIVSALIEAIDVSPNQTSVGSMKLEFTDKLLEKMQKK